MDSDECYIFIKKNYSEISKKADRDYDKKWNSLVKMEFSSYSWFESLANAINGEMKRQVCAKSYMAIFNSISQEYELGTDELKNAIDVAFVENLYWQVSAREAKPFWDLFPNNLRELYIGFHGRTPL